MKERVIMAETDPTSETAEESKPSAACLLPLAVVVAGIGAFFALGFNEYLTFEALSQHRQELLEWTQNNRLMSIVVFMAA